MAKLECTEAIFVHFYKFIQQFAEESRQGKEVKKFSLKVFLKVLKYVFKNKNAEYLIKNREMLFKNREMFKLFEDNDPRFISFEELVPDIYSREEIEKELNDEEVKKNIRYVNFLPGGKQLLQKWGLWALSIVDDTAEWWVTTNLLIFLCWSFFPLIISRV